MEPEKITLRAPLAPPAVEQALRNIVDNEQLAGASKSRYQGTRPLLGEVTANSFRVQKRRNARNDFAPHFHATYRAEGTGTVIEGTFDTQTSMKWFLRIWIAMDVLISLPLMGAAASDMVRGTRYLGGAPWVGFIVPVLLGGFAAVLPKLGGLMGDGDRQAILDILRQQLSA